MRSKVANGVRALGIAAGVLVIGASSLSADVMHDRRPAASAPGALGTTGLEPANPQPDIVLMVIDDGRDESLRYMPNVRHLLGGRGITFDNGYVVNPVCCPSRTSMLTGNYSHTTMVYTNKEREQYGGFAAFADDDTIATRLNDAGYHTGLFGKYLNGYETEYTPPGWDRWFATHTGGAFYDYVVSSNGEQLSFGDAPRDYGTNVLRQRVVEFIRTTDDATPLFAFFAPSAPHQPAIPAPGDGTLFSSLAPHRPPSHDERDVSDKPAHVRSRPRLAAATMAELDRFRLDQLRSLQAVDRAVAAIVHAVRVNRSVRNTLFVFLSDNGMLLGEHRLSGKGEIYEEAIAVPFVVRYDAAIDEPRGDPSLVLNIDLAPTFAEAAGIDLPAEGRSLLPLMEGPTVGWRDAFLIEHLGTGGSKLAPTFCAVHTTRYVLVRYGTGEEELYDLSLDPHQLQNRAGWRRYEDRRRSLHATLRALCDPVPPGFSFAV